MQIHSKQSLQHLQARIFELFTKDTTYTFDTFLYLLSVEIRNFLQVQQCGVYVLDDWEGGFHLNANHKDDGMQWLESFSVHDISFEGSNILHKGEFVNPLVDREASDRSFSVIPLIEDKLYGFFVIQHHSFREMDQQLLRSVRIEVSKSINKVRVVFAALEEKQKYERLYKGTSDFHSTNHSEDVLQQVIQTVKRVYPQFHYYLLLSQDHTCQADLPVKSLTYNKEASSQASAQAYLMGELQIEDSEERDESVLYAPLKGKQGVYGVLQVVSSQLLYFTEAQIEFFDLLSQDAGNALENAQLYQQSRRLNNDLQLINSTSKHLNSTMKLTDKIAYVADRIDQSFGADEVGIILFENESHTSFDILEGSSAFFESPACHSLITKVDRDLVKNDEAVFIGDLTMRLEESFEYHSLMAVPMTDHEYLDGLAIVLHKEPYYFSFDSFKLLQSLVHHSTLAFANSMLHEELERTVITDYLTKLHSRNYLDQKVEHHLNKDKRGHFLLFDIDNFKKVNDTYGHQIGDDVICQVADIIQNTIMDKGLGARWGGEELAVYLPGLTESHAYHLADSIRSTIAVETNPSVTVSCGMASWRSSERPDVKQIVKDADQALYVAKEYGKNRIVVSS
ncbi:diguanylate cyclase [Halobacillus litoralis]|uniref:diguanylate cyclase domain-containing protein n=1 Tax=Halobacillus litoralis TaxID=45668 RepID=UPI001CD35BFF|nr:diguanylate cyclase [Halobacillus litoralis]MCA0969798.1 diguanylate cyclase [Halobacillus litoralis]